MKNTLILLLVVFSTSILSQTETSVLEKANELGSQWKFEEAIELLQNEIKSDSNNAELYYWLGRYSHYIIYDTRPFANKSDKWSSEMVLKNFYKAVELNPNYGDAKYFIAVEHCCRAQEAIKQGDVKQYKKEYLLAEKNGGFPKYILEYARNILNSCDDNAILLVDGDVQLNSIQYLQNIEGYRKDVSMFNYSLTQKPYYVKLQRDGVEEIIKPLPISWSDDALSEMRSYKWKEQEISLPISEKVRKEYSINDTISEFKWMVKPNVGKGKLWSATAVLLNIFETNKWERPIYFTMYGLNDISGFEDNMQITGLTAKFVPKKVKGTIEEYDQEKFDAVMLNSNSYVNFNDVINNNQPRTNGAIHITHLRYINYATYLLDNGNKEKAEMVLNKMEELMPFSAFEPHKITLGKIEVLRDKINKKSK